MNRSKMAYHVIIVATPRNMEAVFNELQTDAKVSDVVLAANFGKQRFEGEPLDTMYEKFFKEEK